MARGKYSLKYRLTTAVCVSMNPASKWHLNITRTRFTPGSGAGVLAGPWSASNEGAFQNRALPRTDFMNVRRCMFHQSERFCAYPAQGKSLPDQSRDRVLFQGNWSGTQSLVELNGPCRTKVRQYKDLLALGIFDRNVSQLGGRAL